MVEPVPVRGGREKNIGVELVSTRVREEVDVCAVVLLAGLKVEMLERLEEDI